MTNKRKNPNCCTSLSQSHLISSLSLSLSRFVVNLHVLHRSAITLILSLSLSHSLVVHLIAPIVSLSHRTDLLTGKPLSLLIFVSLSLSPRSNLNLCFVCLFWSESHHTDRLTLSSHRSTHGSESVFCVFVLV
ncbi:unnamed protein product [Camellia sinensis]